MCALALAACAAGTAVSVGTGTAGAAGGRNPALKFAECMRSHGVSSFPDPSANGGISITPGSGIDPRSPAFQKAQTSCQKEMPGFRGQGPIPAKARARLLAMARCMRSHGVSNFPDPNFSGGGASLGFGPSSGIDPRSPAFQAAARECGGPIAAGPGVRVHKALGPPPGASSAKGGATSGSGSGASFNMRVVPGG
ncbi:MAG: hypothetical protein ACRDNJ_07640 [Solirubrobacteraceae bacterium]